MEESSWQNRHRFTKNISSFPEMVEFAGFLLPIQYPDGISAEHLAVRQSAGLFDVSHMGEIEVSGEQTYAFLDYLLSRSLKKIDDAIASQRALYAVMCAADGTAVDDLCSTLIPDPLPFDCQCGQYRSR